MLRNIIFWMGLVFTCHAHCTEAVVGERVDHLRASDGVELPYRYYEVKDPRGIFLILHGIESHSGWYVGSCRQLAEAGYEVYFPDRRGSGLSSSPRGHIENFQVLIGDIQTFLDRIREKRPGVPIFLMGISWGGKLALLFEALHPGQIEGLVLSTPGLKAKVDLGFKDKLRVAKAALEGSGSDEIEYIRIPIEKPSFFTDDVKWQDWIRKDERTIHRASVQFFRESLKMDAELQTHAKDCRCPVLVQLAGRDEIVDNAGIRSFLESHLSDECRSRLKILLYPEARHTLEFEPNRQQMTQEIIAWADSLRNQ